MSAQLIPVSEIEAIGYQGKSYFVVDLSDYEAKEAECKRLTAINKTLLEECKNSLNDIQKLNAIAKICGVHPLTEMETSLRKVIAKSERKGV